MAYISEENKYKKEGKTGTHTNWPNVGLTNKAVDAIISTPKLERIQTSLT